MASFQRYLEFGLDVTAEDVFWYAADPGWAYGLFAVSWVRSRPAGAAPPRPTSSPLRRTWRCSPSRASTNFAAAPTVYRALRASRPVGGRAAQGVQAGEPLTPEVNEWADDALGISVHDHYGQTEHGMVFCNHHHPDLQRR